jgi:hypothetical protein
MSSIDDIRKIELETMVLQMVIVYKCAHGQDGVLQTRRDVLANFIGRELKLTKVNLRQPFNCHVTAHFLQQSQLARHSILTQTTGFLSEPYHLSRSCNSPEAKVHLASCASPTRNRHNVLPPQLGTTAHLPVSDLL